MALTAINNYPSTKLEPLYDPKDALLMNVNLPANVTYPRGTILGEVTATPGTYKAYLAANVDGSQNPEVILAYDCVTDGATPPNVTFSTSAGQSGQEFGQTQPYAPVYFAGTFQTADLVQTVGPGAIDAAGAAKLGRIIQGTVANGILRVG